MKREASTTLLRPTVESPSGFKRESLSLVGVREKTERSWKESSEVSAFTELMT